MPHIQIPTPMTIPSGDALLIARILDDTNIAGVTSASNVELAWQRGRVRLELLKEGEVHVWRALTPAA
jgi:hypothetical protein